ncbi:rpl22 [Symbiodinium sp. KB8]|nr:rpl22 [Symbiodinium sp. KB8]
MHRRGAAQRSRNQRRKHDARTAIARDDVAADGALPDVGERQGGHCGTASPGIKVAMAAARKVRGCTMCALWMRVAEKASSFTIDLTPANAEDELIAPAEFVNGKPLLSPAADAKKVVIDKDLLPVDEKTGITVSADDNKIVVKAARGGLSKRYLKYLTKRYIAHVGGRAFLRVVATSKDAYTVKQVKADAEEEEEEEEEATE